MEIRAEELLVAVPPDVYRRSLKVARGPERDLDVSPRIAAIAHGIPISILFLNCVLAQLPFLIFFVFEALEDGTIVPVTEEQLPALQEL